MMHATTRLVLLSCLAACSSSGPRSQPAHGVVHVAPPTGDPTRDHAAVCAALERVMPGGTVQFARGVYVLGRSVPLTTPDVAVLGHPEGTVLRGGDPARFDTEPIEQLVVGCTGLELRASRQTIRGLTFEHAWHGILVGRLVDTPEDLRERRRPPDPGAGGHVVEGNRFHACANGIRVASEAAEPTLVRDNDFVDTYHAIVINAGTVHFVDNRVRSVSPERVPVSAHPGDPVTILPNSAASDSGRHRLERNRIEGHPYGILVVAPPGKRCHGIQIRDNVIDVRMVKAPRPWLGVTPTVEDPFVVGLGIELVAEGPGEGVALPAGVVEDVLVTGNVLRGGSGLGVMLEGATRCRIVDNTITGIRRRSPFPGNHLSSTVPQWQHANGAAIWLSPRSNANELAGNRFPEIEGSAVELDGDDNRVDLLDASHTVQDRGSRNRVAFAREPRR